MKHDDIEGILSFLGLGAVGSILTPMPIYGDYLTTHGIWLLSYAEWFKTVGAAYILCLLAQMGTNSTTNLLTKVYRYLRGKK